MCGYNLNTMHIHNSKTFTLQEATELLPSLEKMLEQANRELDQVASELEEANRLYDELEREVAAVDTKDTEKLKIAREKFQDSIQKLSLGQKNYLDVLNRWVDKITDTGVILRDVRKGLLDFPARKGDTEYFLCWCLGESDIDYWHLTTDGFAGRKPLVVLSEYF